MIPDEKDEEGTDLGHTDEEVGEDLGDEKLPPDDPDEEQPETPGDDDEAADEAEEEADLT